MIAGRDDILNQIYRANGRTFEREYRTQSGWSNWQESVKLVVNESIDSGSSKTYSLQTGKLYQIVCAHPYGQGYFAIYAGGTAGAARLNEIKTSSNVTVSVASNANQVTISAVGQATYVRILEL